MEGLKILKGKHFRMNRKNLFLEMEKKLAPFLRLHLSITLIPIKGSKVQIIQCETIDTQKDGFNESQH